jgi:vitamin B12 transporter
MRMDARRMGGFRGARTPTLAAVAAATVATVVAGRQAGAQVARDTAVLTPRVVTATRAPDPLHAAPMAATVLSGADLRARGVVFVSDALREVPGAMVVQTGSFGAPTSLFLRGGESDYVKVLLDGIPLNVPGGAVNLANLTTAGLDRIEIVRGPASVLYGADAMGGVLQLFTATGAGAPHGTLAADGGTFDTGDLVAHAGGGDAHWGFSAGATRFTSAGIYPFNSAYRNAVASGSVSWHGDDGALLRLVARYGDAIDHYPTDAAGAPVDHNQYTTERRLELGIDASRDVGHGVTLDVHPFAARLASGFHNRSDSPADTSGFGFAGRSDVITWRRGVDLRADWRAMSAVLISLGTGIEREQDNEWSTDLSDFGEGPVRDSSGLVRSRTTTNLFAQLLADPVPGWSLQLGARVDDNSAFGSYGTWRGGAAWHGSTGLRLWAAVGTAFKAPTFGESFANSAFEVGNPDLRPEQSHDADIGVEQRIGRATLGVTAFLQHFRDLIEYVSAAPGEPTYLNVGAARSRGLEATAAFRAGGPLRVTAHWTWLSTAVTDTGAAASVGFADGARLLRRPASSGGAVAEYRPGGLLLSLAATWVGRRDDVDYNRFPAARITLPSYWTLDLASSVPLGRVIGHLSGMALTFRAENLFDAAYQQTVGFPGRGRTVLAGARVQF